MSDPIQQGADMKVARLTKPVTLETTFSSYFLDELLGQGGSGRVYGGTSSDGAAIAVKVLNGEQATTDKRRRFKNEIWFLAQNRHQNIVSVLDHGIVDDGVVKGPFYVMRRYDGSLRDLMQGTLSGEDILALFAKILDGVEAAHLQRAIHRDLKPENILIDSKTQLPAIADFGIASFTDDLVATLVDTAPGQRLANFQYAAPEQRAAGKSVGATADIYALGLMLNEMFTANLPHGTEYELIAKHYPDFGFLDAVVEKMMRQAPSDRYQSVADVKGAIALHRSEFSALQKISAVSGTVIPSTEIDDPLALSPPEAYFV